jgi:hypothetical protein
LLQSQLGIIVDYERKQEASKQPKIYEGQDANHAFVSYGIYNLAPKEALRMRQPPV